jgi:hypothetical protein
MSSHATGPRSDAGKERSSRNAVRHGLRSERPVIPGEDADEWDAFRDAVVHDLDPATTLEHELAERAALQLWRLRRAARYEAEVAADEIERVQTDAANGVRHGLDGDDVASQALRHQFEKMEQLRQTHTTMEAARDLARQLADLPAGKAMNPDHVLPLLVLVGCTHPGLLPDPADTATAGELRRTLAARASKSVAASLAFVRGAAEEACQKTAAKLAAMDEEILSLVGDVGQSLEAKQRDQRLLQKPALDRVVRYEAHVSRQLNQALQLLREFRAERRARDEAGPTTTPAPATTAITTAAGATAPPFAATAPAADGMTAAGPFGNSDGVPVPASPPPLPVVAQEFVRHFPDGPRPPAAAALGEVRAARGGGDIRAGAAVPGAPGA